MKRRAEVLFDEVLSCQLDRQVSSAERADSFAMRVGVPSLNGPSISFSGVPAAGAEELASLGSIIASMEDATAREAIEQNVEAALEELSETERPSVGELKELLNGTLDRLRTLRDRGRGALGLRNALPEDRHAWRLLTVSVLKRTFAHQVAVAPITLSASWKFLPESGCALHGGRHGIASHGPLPSILLTVDRPAQIEARVELKHGRKSLGQCVIPPGASERELHPSWDGVDASSIALVLTATAGDLPRAVTKLFLERPVDSAPSFFLVATLSKDLAGVKGLRRIDPSDDGDQEESVDIDSFTAVFAVSRSEELSVTLDGLPVDQEVLAQGISRISIDMSRVADAGSPPELVLTTADTSIALQLAANQKRGGDCNLELALAQSLHSNPSGANAVSSLRAWCGDFDARPLLGSPDDGQERRFRLALTFEHASEPWRPIVLSSPLDGPTALIEKGSFRVADDMSSVLGAALAVEPALSEDVCALVASYDAARRELKEAVDFRHGSKSRVGLPLYALASFNYEEGDAVSRAAVGYLQAFSRIQKALASGSYSYVERFLLAYLDTVVCTRGGGGAWEIVGCAVGPWHPLVVAKRMMVGRGIRRLAEIQSSELRWLRRLGVLLEGTTGFRWFAGLGAESSHLVPFYVDATDDPGWLLLSSTTGGSDEIIDGEPWGHALLGLTGLRGGGGEARGLTGYLADYFRAFPSKRSIVAKLSGEATGCEAASAARAFLTVDGKATSSGQSLKGGIHIVIDGDGGDADDYPDWAAPVVCVYPRGGDGFLANHQIDMLLARPALKAAFPIQSEQEVGLFAPRGDGVASVLQLPLRTLDASGSGVSDSRLSYNSDCDTSEDLGAAFATAVADAQSASGPCRSVAVRTLTLDAGLKDAVWTVLPGEGADPAVLLNWARESSKSGTPRVLWDYRLAIAQSARSYYVLSEVPRTLVHHLSTSAVFKDLDRAGAALLELARIGLALGSEAFKSRSRALGVAGLVGAARVAQIVLQGACADEEECCAFVLPIDSFRDLLGGDLEGGTEADVSDYRRGDLIGVVCRTSQGCAELAFCSIESKYSSSTYSEGLAEKALEQAARSLARLVAISRAAGEADALAERVALAKLLEFGLRLDASRNSDVISAVLSAVLKGKHRTGLLGSTGCIVVSTEIAAVDSGVRELDEGVWVRLAPCRWPDEAGDFQPIAAQLISLQKAPWRARADAVSGPAAHHDHREVTSVVASASPDSSGSGDTSLSVEEERKSDVASTDHKLAPLSLLLGVSDVGRPVTWRAGQNSNHNFMVTGSSGLGKTQLLKSVLLQSRNQGLPALILDFKNDFASDKGFLEAARLDVQYVSFEGLPYNPLIPCPQPDPRTGELTYPVSQHLTGIVSTFQRTYGLGEQQAAALKDAIRTAFDSAGIASTGMAREIPGQFPDFALVGEHLRETNRLAYNRLDPLFDLEIFREKYRNTAFSELLGKGYVLDLSGIQADHIQNTLAMLLVHSAHRYLNSLPHAASVNQLLVFDEAHRILRSDDVERLVRECRAYGLGVLLSSQYPTDFPADTAANLATKVLHGNGPDVSRVQAIRSTLGLSPDMDGKLNLGMFHAAMLAMPGQVVLARTLGYPHQLILEAVRNGAHAVAEVRQVRGMHEDKFDSTLEHLVQTGLVTVIGDQVSLAG
ncbi:ATP-binding protein [Luteimonas sp. MC1572]|uniref:ATP-binding protein n=1 Tax=Luteimonas sp. MC1572 TaxID=2799325 RepID=UPI0018F0F623|nr:ATP-binding protein [Luteimonas sp. MC1572]MBJ6980917.1 ATP-binding protein [Luteimonas sp. MC1572]QQO02273.1 ATP-binding protein [Luteimonas sp. MC1572]